MRCRSIVTVMLFKRTSTLRMLRLSFVSVTGNVHVHEQIQDFGIVTGPETGNLCVMRMLIPKTRGANAKLQRHRLAKTQS